MILFLSEIKDEYSQENFKRIREFFREQSILRGEWEHMEISIPSMVTNFKYPHKLGFLPKDILQTSLIGESIIWNYDRFDSTYLDITTGGACTVRAFVGRYDSRPLA
jgi:hypothetical protein